MRERIYDAYRVQSDAHGNDGYGYRGGNPSRGGFKGRGRGRGGFKGFKGFRDCQNPTTTCKYCRVVNHVMSNVHS